MHKQPIKIDSHPHEAQLQQLWTYKECAAFLRIGPDALRHHMSDGKIPPNLYVRLWDSQTVRFIPQAVIEYVKSGNKAQA